MSIHGLRIDVADSQNVLEKIDNAATAQVEDRAILARIELDKLLADQISHLGDDKALFQQSWECAKNIMLGSHQEVSNKRFIEYKIYFQTYSIPK
jgi:hypothetical protein